MDSKVVSIEESLLTTKELAAKLNRSPAWVRKMAIAGKFPYVDGGLGEKEVFRLFKLSSVNAALEALQGKTA